MDTVVGEQEQSSRVLTVEGGLPFCSINEAGEKVELGQLSYQDFGDDRELRALTFASDNGGTPAHLGAQRARGQGFSVMERVVDHYEILEPILELGYVPKIVRHAKKGASIFAVLQHPEIKFPDPITWDKGLFPEESTALHLSIGVYNHASARKAATFITGCFRVLCANGLISKHLSLGSFRIGKNAFTRESMMERFDALGLNGRRNLSVQAFDPSVLTFIMNNLRMMVDTGDAYPLECVNMPEFVSKPMLQLDHHLPKWAKEDLYNQMTLVQGNTETFSQLDALNMITNLSRASDSSKFYFRLETFMSTIWTLAAIGAFKEDARQFRVEIEAI